jgi:hypothetical protein
MNNYCTLFDSNYLTRGLSMYESLVKSDKDFTLYIYCFDRLCYDILKKLQLDSVVFVSLSEFETETLKNIKSQRSRVEYCWTCTPHVIRYSVENFNLPQITYLDADLYFFRDPSVLLDELNQSGGSVLITEHRYTPRYDQSSQSGTYCVQFVSFKADERGLEVLNWWHDRCIEWCYLRFENGKFGDQKYLDDWTSRFKGVHVLKHLGGGVAPWNVQQYKIGPGPVVNDIPLIFYHFHHLIWYADNSFNLGLYKLSGDVISQIYMPYLSQLERSLKQVQFHHEGFNLGKIPKKYNISTLLKQAKQRLLGFGENNVIQR